MVKEKGMEYKGEQRWVSETLIASAHSSWEILDRIQARINDTIDSEVLPKAQTNSVDWDSNISLVLCQIWLFVCTGWGQLVATNTCVAARETAMFLLVAAAVDISFTSHKSC